MKILVTGADGLVGRALSRHCTARSDTVNAYNRQTLDITNSDAVGAAFRRDLPDAVINCAAWTDVDGCESDPDRALSVNALAVETLAIRSGECGAGFLTISTDFVFDGTKEGFYTQRDDPHPISVYGDSKLRGERRAQQAYARTIVVRTGWIFGIGGTNFLSTVVDRARRGDRIKAICDAYGTPTYADDLAGRLRELAQLDIPGVFHVVNNGAGASYEDFARAALEAAKCDGVDIERVSMEALERPARRPHNSRLRCVLSEAIGLPPLPDWKVSLKAFTSGNSQ